MSLSNLWPHRWLLLNFLSREIKNRYVGSISGFFWALLNPLALLGVYALVFTVVFKVKFPELDDHSFILFVAVALWPWLCFQEGVQRGTLAVQQGAGLVKKVAFPHELLVHGAVLATYAVHITGFLLVLLALGIAGQSLHFSTLPLVLILIAVQLLFTSGLALVLAALQVLMKDVEHFLAPLMMIWFYVTPIVYPLNLTPPQMQTLIALNPLTCSITHIRELLMHGNSQIGWQDAGMLGVAILFFFAGRWFFNRLSPSFEDFI